MTRQNEFIPVFKPLIMREEVEASVEALEMGWLGMGSYVSKFERQLEETVAGGQRHAVALSTGHASIHLALLLAGAGPGDEIITPSFNNIADFQAILATGAQPVFCDIDEATLCIDLDKAEVLIGEHTKAMIVMDYACMLCDHARIQSIAKTRGIRIIHDAAHSFGSTWQGKAIGSFSDLCMFSFDPVKTITCIDGGALMVGSQEEVERLHELRLIGMTQRADTMYQNKRAWSYDVRELGFRYHMSNLHASIGLAQLAKLDDIRAARKSACQYYEAHLSGIPHVYAPAVDLDNITPFIYYVRVPSEDRDAFRRALHERGVDTGLHWQPGHRFTLLESCRRGDLSVTEKIADEIVTLPFHSDMSEETLHRVVCEVSNFFEAKHGR